MSHLHESLYRIRIFLLALFLFHSRGVVRTGAAEDSGNLDELHWDPIALLLAVCRCSSYCIQSHSLGGIHFGGIRVRFGLGGDES